MSTPPNSLPPTVPLPDSPGDDRPRRVRGLRAAGLSIGLLGATTVGGLAGWFTLTGQVPDTSAVTAGTQLAGSTSVASSQTGTTSGLPVGRGSGPAHTRSGGS